MNGVDAETLVASKAADEASRPVIPLVDLSLCK
jgi:hypothetical protein